MSLRESKKEKRGGTDKENRIIMIAIVTAILVFILWWLYGYHYVIVPSGELIFRAP